MARSSNQKLKLLFLAKIFEEKSDDDHKLTMPKIIEELNRYDIEANRKSIYTDIEALQQYGMDIIKTREGALTYYHLGSRDFEVAELKFLVDAIQASKFISENKTRVLIKKLEKSVSTYDASLLERTVTVSGRVKSMNESIYYTIDEIYNGITNDKCITFRYFSWNVRGEEEFRRNGAYYVVAPWALHFDDEKYYLVAYDMEKKEIRHFRVDKMRDVSITDTKRKGVSEFKKTKKEKYNSQYFRMFGGEIERVTLKCKNEMANVIVDQFGKEVWMIPLDDNYFKVNVDVAVSDQFFGWVFALGGAVTIAGPESVREEMKEALKRTYI
jgi:hypothetical protein